MTARPKKNPKTNEAQVASPVRSVPSRSIHDMTRLLLFVRAGGRCEFDGDNKYLLRHSLTLTEGNFAQMAHIVAFSPQGPRGVRRLSVKDLNAVGNLMLLCPECHKLVATHPERYSTKTLRLFKQRHEERIHRLTGTHPDYQTRVVILKSKIGEQAVDISPGELQD